MQAINADGVVAEWTEFGRFRVTGPNAAPEIVSMHSPVQEQRKVLAEVEIRDPNGTGDVETIEVVVNDRNELANGCALSIRPSGKNIWLRSNTGDYFIGYLLAGSSSVAQNSQCRVYGSEASIAATGDVLRIRPALEIKGVMAGEQRIFARAIDKSETASNWAEFGPIAVPPDPDSQPPRVQFSRSPPVRGHAFSGSLTVRNPDGARDISFIDLLFGASPDDAQPCWFRYNRRLRRFELRSEDNSEWLQPEPSALGLEHARCWIPADVALAAPDDTSIRIPMGAAFRTAFPGVKGIWVRAADASGADSGWRKSGDFTVSIPSVNRAPVAGTVMPVPGVGAAAALPFPATDPDGSGDLRTLLLRLQAVEGKEGWCMIAYQPLTAVFLLASDDAPGWLVYPAMGATVATGRCRLLRTDSLSLTNGLEPKAWVAFDGSLAGPLRLSQQAIDMAGAESGWSDSGQWVAAFPNRAPFAIQLDPVTGQGNEQTLEIRVEDPDCAQDLDRVDIVISPDGAAHNSCKFFVDPQAKRFGFYLDTGTSYYYTLLSSTAIYANGQCALQPRTLDVWLEDGRLQVRAPVRFLAGLSGANRIAVTARDLPGASHTLENAGSWTVPEPEPNRTPETIRLERTPSGSDERLKAVFPDPDGYGHLAVLDLKIGDSAPYCGFRYDRRQHTLQLLSVDGNSRGGPVFGTKWHKCRERRV